MHRSFFRILKWIPVCIVSSVVAIGCGAPGAQRVSVDASPNRVRYVVGAFEPAGIDPVSVTADGSTVVDIVVLEGRSPGAAAAFREESVGDRVDSDALDRILDRAWRLRPPVEADLDAFAARTGYLERHDEWFRHEVVGSMTSYRRRLHIPLAAVRSAILSLAEGRGLRYPPGTVVVGEHLDAGGVVETTVMTRRSDGFWDFAAYGREGLPVDRIRGTTEDLRIPADCYGCHYGDRAFEPQRSFPETAPDGPLGPRALFVPPGWRRADVTARLDEHARREDGLLGLHATLRLAALLAERDAGTGAGSDDDLVSLVGF